MRIMGIVDRGRFAFQTVFLITVLGVLFGWPLRAAPAPENASFRIEIDLGSAQEWTLRATGPVRVGKDGAFVWPFRQEGFSPISTASFSHRRLGSEEPAQHFLPIANAGGDGLPSPANFGYAPGDLVEIGLVRRIRPIAGGGIDQAFVFPSMAGSAPVILEVVALRPNTQMRHSGMLTRGGAFDLRGARQRFEPELRRTGASALHEFSTAPRLFLSTHADYHDLGEAMKSLLREPDREIVERAARVAPADATIERVVAASLADVQASNGSPLERALQLRSMLVSRNIAADLVFTNRRVLLALPEIPVGLFDATLVSVPVAGMMLDPIALPETGIGLDPELGGQDALRLTPNGGTLERLPLVRAAANRIFVRADLQIGRDGTIEGQSLTEARGMAAVQLQQLLNKLHAGPADAGISKLLHQQSLDGQVRLGPVDQRDDVVGQHLSFRLSPLAGEDTVLRIPTIPGPRLFRPPFVDLVSALRGEDVAVVPCRAVTIEHQIVLHLPDRRMLVDQPRDVSVTVAMGSYQVRYEVEPTRVIVRRRLEFEPGRAFCTREQVLEMAPLIRATSRDLARMLHLRLPTG